MRFHEWNQRFQYLRKLSAKYKRGVIDQRRGSSRVRDRMQVIAVLIMMQQQSRRNPDGGQFFIRHSQRRLEASRLQMFS